MPEQLRMVLDEKVLQAPPQIALADGYALHTLADDEGRIAPAKAEEFVAMMVAAGFEDWSADQLESMCLKALPDGIFIAVAEDSGAIAATAMATHNPEKLHPFGGELGWVACRPQHRGHHLGTAVCAAVIRRYAAAGYRHVYLKTDDWRLPAIKTYLKLGFRPLFHQPDMKGRWEKVCEKLAWPL